MSHTIKIDGEPTLKQEILLEMLEFEHSITFQVPPAGVPDGQMDARRFRKTERRVRDAARLRVEYLLVAIADTGATVERTDR